MKRLKKNIYTVATNERAITGSANVLCATKWFITAKIMIADYQQKGEHIMADLKIFTENIEHEALNQIYTLVKQPAFSDCKIRIMPDVHAGAGCVIGFTADLGEKVIPNIVGVDIGCGMLTTNLGNIDIDFERWLGYSPGSPPVIVSLALGCSNNIFFNDSICALKLLSPCIGFFLSKQNGQL